MELPLSTRELGRNLEAHETIGSTNARALELARSGAPHGTLVLARAQTEGRGRLGRRWDSPPGAGLYASFVLDRRWPTNATPLLSLAAGLATLAAIERLAPVRAALKWPNDLLDAADLRKLAGVLAEASGERVVLGIGVNLTPEGRDPALAHYASSILEASGARVELGALAAALAEALERELDRLDPPSVVARFASRAAGLGAEVEIGELAGRLEGLAPDGALRIRLHDGSIRGVYAGDLRIPGAPTREAR